jgi:hypothetical protein
MDLAHLGARPLYSSATITWYQPPSTGTGSSLAQGHVTPSAIYTYTYVHVCVCVCVCVRARAGVLAGSQSPASRGSYKNK